MARERIAGAPATVKVDVSCAPMVAGPSPAPTLPPDACGTDDLLTVKVYTPSTGPEALHLFTPIIGQLIPAPVVSGQAQVVIQ